MAQVVTASTFKAKCLALLDEVANGGREILITKRGRPVARVVPAEPAAPLLGSVTYAVGDDELTEPIQAPWQASD